MIDGRKYLLGGCFLFLIIKETEDTTLLTTEDLLSCDKVPNICDVSLELYKDFSNKYLLDNVFTYEFTDGDSINVRFKRQKYSRS